jgi:hypothetical protein
MPRSLDNPWRWWFEEEPATTYQLQRPQTGSPSFLDYYRSPANEGRVFGDYNLANARLAEQGLPPNIAYYDYLADYPFQTEYARRSPTQRGGTRPSTFGTRSVWRIPPGY